MIPKSLLERLATDPRLPERSREALRETAKHEEQWRQLREAYRATSQRRCSQRAITPSIVVFDCNESESLPGTPVNNPGSSSDPTARRAFDQAAAVVRFYKEVFDRNSIDGIGMTVISSIHYSRFYCNAQWTGSEMVYGDGDGMIFKDFTNSDDFIGHELTHGVTQYTAGLMYTDEPGALNESMSDAFGSMFRQWSAAQTVGQADWLIGADLMGPTAAQHGWVCIRDLSNPGSIHSMAQQPADYAHYIPGGDAHDNSGIPNRAFYLAASGIGGFSWEKAGHIWYHSLTSKEASSHMTFKEFAELTLKCAKTSCACDQGVYEAVKDAWIKVGVLDSTDAFP